MPEQRRKQGSPNRAVYNQIRVLHFSPAGLRLVSTHANALARHKHLRRAVLRLQAYGLDVMMSVLFQKLVHPPPVATIEHKVLGALHDRPVQIDDLIPLERAPCRSKLCECKIIGRSREANVRLNAYGKIRRKRYYPVDRRI
jgi:hypothetical protein